LQKIVDGKKSNEGMNLSHNNEQFNREKLDLLFALNSNDLDNSSEYKGQYFPTKNEIEKQAMLENKNDKDNQENNLDYIHQNKFNGQENYPLQNNQFDENEMSEKQENSPEINEIRNNDSKPFNQKNANANHNQKNNILVQSSNEDNANQNFIDNEEIDI